MAILIFQHEAVETPARIADALNETAHRLRVVELFAGQQPPADLDDIDRGLRPFGDGVKVYERRRRRGY